MATCPACGAEVSEGSRFCNQCGHEVIAPIGDDAKDTVAVSTLGVGNEKGLQTPPGIEDLAAELPPAVSEGLPGQIVARPSFFITTKGIIAVAVIVILIAGGVLFGIIRHNALVRSGAAYTKAQTDIESGNLKAALSDLQEVVPYDPNYSKAQDQIKSVKQSQDIITLANNILKDSAKYDSDLSSFWQNYGTVVDKTNAAWQDYSSYLYSSNAQQDLAGVDATMATLTSDTSNIGQDVSSISADFGEVASNSLLNDFNTATLLDSYKDSSDQANIMSTAISDESNWLESGSFVFSSVPQAINTTNMAFSTLQTDQLKSDQGTAQFLGYAMGNVDKLLGQPITLHNIKNNSDKSKQTPNSSATSPTITESLTTFNDSNNGIIVDAPSGWTKAPITGGDYSGWRFVNPSDPNEEEILVTSGDVGGYTKPDGSSDPSLVIPETNVSGTFTFNYGLSVGYTFYQSGNPYEGNGVVTVSTDKNGYGYVEILLPPSEKTLATNILNSFKLTL